MPREFIVRPVDGSFSLKENIYDVLWEGIMAMDIYAVDAQLKLDERKLSDQPQISRTPIREALARLEQEGLVRVVPRKGVFILRKSVDQILEMITVWAALESMAARLVSERASDLAVASLRKLLASFGQDEAKSHLDEYSEANIRSHRRILELSGCALLLSTADSLFLHMRAIRARTMIEDDRIKRSIVDMMTSITKFAAGVQSTERVADMISMAARESVAGAYGPSYLEIPRDILDHEIDIDKAVIPEPGAYRASTKSIGDPRDVERLADILVKAKTPCILIGTQVWNCRGDNEAIRLARELNIPLNSMAPVAASCLRAILTITIARAGSLSMRPMSSSSSARPSTSAWATASRSPRKRSSSRSIRITAPSARTAT